MSRYLVTGGAGFIGSHLVGALVSSDNRVRVLDNFSTGKESNLADFDSRAEILKGDIRDENMVSRAVKDVDVVFHMAAYISVPQSMQDPKECYDTNVRGTEILLEAARKAGVRRVILASSAAVYGDSEDLPLQEATSLKPLSPYAASKQINETYAGLYTRVFGLEVVTLRYFNVFGPRQSPNSIYAAAVPIFIHKFLANQPVTIFGDGNQTRDLVYVRDVVLSNLTAAEAPNAPGEIFNICTGHEIRILDVIAALKDLFPVVPDVNFTDPRIGDIYRSVGSPQKAIDQLGFIAKTSLKEGLMETIEWMRN